MNDKRPFLLLMVLDGFGCRAEKEWNAIAQAKTPVIGKLFAECPWSTVEASSLFVGLPEGQMGNSEVGHLNIGAGRVVDQDNVRITKTIEHDELKSIPLFVETIERLERLKKSGDSLHLIGLLSDGGVHSLETHLFGLIDAAIADGMTTRDGLPTIYIHAILDGRDTPPRSAKKYVRELLDYIDDKPQVHLSTIIGRYYTMDRDKRWDRTKRGYDLMTLGIGTETKTPFAAIDRCYEGDVNDEFMEPLALQLADGAHHGKIEDGDTILFFNFRADRMRQIVRAFLDPTFDGFERSVHPKVDIVTLNRYAEEFDFPVLFPPVRIKNYLGQVLAANGIKQLRIAETEKYAHVTFFFNGGSDEVSPGEDRVLIPSAKVATYDKKPAMSVVELSARVVDEVKSGKYGVVILNIANPDMVGHTGFMDATVAAVEATDAAVGRILEAVRGVDGVTIITADHGNAELMFDSNTGQPHTAHTTFPVPVILVDPNRRDAKLRKGGALENIAPTILEILGIEKPSEMTAESLLVR